MIKDIAYPHLKNFTVAYIDEQDRSVRNIIVRGTDYKTVYLMLKHSFADLVHVIEID